MVLDNTLSSWLEHIETLHSKPIDMGLERMKEMLARMKCLIDICYIYKVV